MTALYCIGDLIIRNIYHMVAIISELVGLIESHVLLEILSEVREASLTHHKQE